MNSQGRVIGVISDTHGLLRPEAVRALQGCSLILHAGDIGSPEIIPTLRRIAPVVAVRGNVDSGAVAREFHLTEAAEAGGLSLYMLHNMRMLDLDPHAAGFAAVISGHSHQPEFHFESKKGSEVLYLNPGSAGPRRFSLPITLARLRMEGCQLMPEIVELIPQK